MELLCKSTGRKFVIFDVNVGFVQKLLSYDISNNTSQFFQKYKWIGSNVANMAGYTIDSALKNLNIYEINVGGEIRPLINPTKEQLKKIKKFVTPLTNKRKKFLKCLSEFLKENSSLDVT